MKRPADDGLLRPQFPHSPSSAKWKSDTLVRTVTNGVPDSLADPAPGGVATLTALLNEHFAESDRLGSLPDARDDAHANAILSLDSMDVAPLGPQTACACMQLLLALGQPKLMIRLAQLSEAAYALDVGDSVQKADVLARMGKGWPSSRTVTVVVSNQLPHEGVELLGRFNPPPHCASLTVVADGRQGQVGALNLGEVLKLREYPTLTLIGGPYAYDTFHALIGIRAESVVFATSNTTSPAHQAEWDACGSVLSSLLQEAGAKTLVLGDLNMPYDVAGRLVACWREWTCVRTPLTQNLLDLARTGQHTIARLELDLMAGHVLEPVTQLMQALQALRTTSLVVHGHVNLVGFAQALEAFALATPLQGSLLHRLEASFVVKVGADVAHALAQMARDLRVEEVVHTFMPLLEGTSYAPPDAAALTRIQVHNLANKAMALARTGGGPTSDSATWRDAVDTVSALLAPDKRVSAVGEYLRSSRNTLIDVSDVSWHTPESELSSDLVSKLMLLPTYGFAADLLREAVVHRLGLFPQEIQSMCNALIVSQFPLIKRRPADWLAEAAPYRSRSSPAVARPGMAADAAAVTTATTTNTVGITTTTTTATTTTTTTTHAALVPSTPVPGPTPAALKASLVDMVEPRGEQALHRLAQYMRERLQAWPPGSLRKLGYETLIDLFSSGRLNLNKHEKVSADAVHELLQVGQMRLVHFLATLGPELRFAARTPEQARHLEQLAMTPVQAGGRYALRMTSDLSGDALRRVLTFAASVPPRQLRLTLAATEGAAADFWPTLANFVCAHDGLHLELATPERDGPPMWAMVEFVRAMGQASLRGFGLADGFENAGGELRDELLKSVKASGATALRLESKVQVDVAEPLLVSQHWQSVELLDSIDYADLFYADEVSATTLRLKPWENEVGFGVFARTCRGLETLELVGGSVKVGDVVECLMANPGIRSVTCKIVPLNAEEIGPKLAPLRHRSPVNFNITNADVSVKAPFARVVFQWRTRQSAFVAREVGRAFATGIDSGFGDAGAGIGGMLDGASTKALSRTNKAAHAGYSKAQADEINRFARMLSSNTPYETFRAALLSTMNEGSPFNNLAGPLVDTHPDNPVLGKAMDMRRAGVPRDLIRTMIRAQLDEASVHTPQLLEAFAYFGFMEPAQWLRLGYGIAVKG